MRVVENATDIRNAVNTLRGNEADVVFCNPANEPGVTYVLCLNDQIFAAIKPLFEEELHTPLTLETDEFPTYVLVEESAEPAFEQAEIFVGLDQVTGPYSLEWLVD
jgi:hypothetical protein